MNRIIITIALLAITTLSHAADLELGIRKDFYSNDNLDAGESVVIKLVADNGPYLYALAGQAYEVISGQGMADIKYASIGIGIKRGLFEYVVGYIQAGYYHPSIGTLGSTPEALDRYAECQVGNKGDVKHSGVNPYLWDKDISMDGGFGGEIGADFRYEVTRRVLLSLGAGYRLLQLGQTVEFKNAKFMAANNGGFWQFKDDLDMSGGFLKFSAVWVF